MGPGDGDENLEMPCIVLSLFCVLLPLIIIAVAVTLSRCLHRPELPEEARAVPEPGRRWRDREPQRPTGEGIQPAQDHVSERTPPDE